MCTLAGCMRLSPVVFRAVPFVFPPLTPDSLVCSVSRHQLSVARASWALHVRLGCRQHMPCCAFIHTSHLVDAALLQLFILSRYETEVVTHPF